MYRVLVTINRALSGIFLHLPSDRAPMLIVHGDAAGADTIARKWAENMRVYDDVAGHEAHPADWDRACDQNCRHKPRTRNGRPYCPAAGSLRNQHMVDLGADVCLAFPLPESIGTFDCMRRAKTADIRIERYYHEAP